MGHWMVMAGGFARATRGRASGAMALGYGGALAKGGHAEHGVDVWPPVAPMNAHEIRATAQLGVALWRDLGLSAALSGAVPLGSGAFLASVGGGLTYQIGRFGLGAGARHGLAGSTTGLVLDAHVMAGF